jgi:hypothetical protein
MKSIKMRTKSESCVWVPRTPSKPFTWTFARARLWVAGDFFTVERPRSRSTVIARDGLI